ncbi:MAG TPA: membrane-bound lytic murein transglycosylase MltF [Steroidobacteraceae bacterium]
MRCQGRALIRGLTVAGLWFAVASCAPERPALESIHDRGELRVVTLNAPTTYYYGAHGPEGLEYEFASEFAKELGVPLRMYPVASAQQLRDELTHKRADIAAAQITYDSAWLRSGVAAAPYEQLRQVVIYRRDAPRPRDLDAVGASAIAVSVASPQAALLAKLHAGGYAQLRWQELAKSADEVLAAVDDRRADFALVDANAFGFARNVYPDLAIAFDLAEQRPVQWIVRPAALDLRARIDAFFRELRSGPRFAAILGRAGSEPPHFRYLAASGLLDHIAERLPALRPMFEQAATLTGIDWRLLAAIGYQESQWDTQASSEDGAGGIMMLMPDTAAALGVADRKDPLQNILAGAKYFRSVLEKFPERIPEPDRTWLAVAAYNVGFGHLEDARVITQMQSRDPDRWSEVRTRLPLLAQEQWFTRVKHGYARGWEPVAFVTRVQEFLNVLEWRGATAPVTSD